MSRTQRPDRKGFDKLLYEQHVERIRSMKPSVDNHPPRPHPLSNKCEIDKRRKFAAIEFDNRLLLERLAKIVQKKTIDNEIHDFIERQKVFKAKLAEEKKKTVANRITEENRRLLQRIQEVPPVYNHIEWEEQAREREHIVKTMVVYPEFYQKRVEESKLVKKLPSLDTQYREVMGSRAGTMRSLSSSHRQRSYTAPSESFSTLDGTSPSNRYIASK